MIQLDEHILEMGWFNHQLVIKMFVLFDLVHCNHLQKPMLPFGPPETSQWPTRSTWKDAGESTRYFLAACLSFPFRLRLIVGRLEVLKSEIAPLKSKRPNLRNFRTFSRASSLTSFNWYSWFGGRATSALGFDFHGGRLTLEENRGQNSPLKLCKCCYFL